MEIFDNIRNYFNEKSKFWAANYPKAWSMGWLTQLCLAAILYFITLVVALLLPVSPTDTPDVSTWYGLGYIPAFLWGIFIIYRLVKYNSEKLFGNRKFIHNFIELPTYLIQFILPLGIPLILGFLLVVRIGNVVEDDQLNNDKIVFEEAQPFFTFDFGTGNYYYANNDSYPYYLDEMDYDYFHEMFRYFKNDEAYLKYILGDSIRRTYDDEHHVNMIRDSINKYEQVLKDSIAFHRGVFKESRPKLYPYRFYHFPYNIDQVESRYFGDPFSLDPDSAKQYYFYEHYHDDAFVKEKLGRLLIEMKSFGYEVDPVFTGNELLEIFQHNVYHAETDSKIYNKVKSFDHMVSGFRSQINYIQDCKNRDFYFLYDAGMYSILFGMIFAFSLVLGLFKNMSWVEFLVGLFLLFLIPIILGIIMAIMRWNQDTVHFTFWGIFVGLFVWGIIEKKKGLRRKRGAFLLMVPHLVMAYVPVFILATLDSVFHFWEWDYFDKYLIHSPTKYDPDRMVYMDQYWELRSMAVGFMMIVGYALYILVLYPLWIKIDWLRYMAKPKKS